MLLSDRILGKLSRRRDDAGEAAEVFVQPNRGLLADALSRPLGLVALAAMVLGGLILYASWGEGGAGWPADYALMILFVAVAAFVVVVLRAGEPKLPRPSGGFEPHHAPPEPVETVMPQRRPARRTAKAPAAAPATGRAAAPAALAAEPDAPVTLDGGSSFESYRRALLYYQRINDQRGQGEVLRRLGHLAKSKNRLQDSRDLYISARSCFREVGDSYAEAAVLLDLGQVLEAMGEHETAGAAFREANRSLLDVAISSNEPAPAQDRRRRPPVFDHAAD
jgi:hypothetical protein